MLSEKSQACKQKNHLISSICGSFKNTGHFTCKEQNAGVKTTAKDYFVVKHRGQWGGEKGREKNGKEE